VARNAPGQADAAQEAADARDLFVLAEAKPRRSALATRLASAASAVSCSSPGSGFSKVSR
jgi:hypothetical protein